MPRWEALGSLSRRAEPWERGPGAQAGGGRGPGRRLSENRPEDGQRGWGFPRKSLNLTGSPAPLRHMQFRSIDFCQTDCNNPRRARGCHVGPTGLSP